MRRWCSRHSFFCSCDSAVRFVDSEISSQRRLLLRPRRAESISLGPGLKHPSLRSDSSLAAKRRAEALHLVFFFKHPSPARELRLCGYSRMIRSHERRALGALLSLFSRSKPASTDSKLQSGCGEARRLRSRVVVVFIVQRIDRYTRTRTFVCTTAAVRSRLCSQDFYLN